jgi:hypothetical protein
MSVGRTRPQPADRVYGLPLQKHRKRFARLGETVARARRLRNPTSYADRAGLEAAHALALLLNQPVAADQT